jgi:hypothetical protein
LKAKTGSTTQGSCIAYDATSNCVLSAAGANYADSAAASLKCIKCKENFYAKDANSVSGACEALNDY